MSTLRDVATVSNSDCIVVRFSTEDYAPHERIEALHEVFGRSLQKVHVEPVEPESFQTAVTLRRMPGLSQMTGYRSAAIYRRSRELIEHDDVILVGGFTSDYEAHHRGRTLNMGPGEAVILTGAEPSSFGGLAQNSVQLLRVPVRLLSPLAADLESAYGRIIPRRKPCTAASDRIPRYPRENGCCLRTRLRTASGHPHPRSDGPSHRSNAGCC